MLSVSEWTEIIRPQGSDQYEGSQSPLPSGSLDEVQAKKLFARFGVPTVAEIAVSSAAEALSAAHALGPRVVLKILSSGIAHKSDVGGVAIGVTAECVASQLSIMIAAVERVTGHAPQRFVVQSMVEGAMAEIIVGLQRDALGTVILVGAGGVGAELFDDTSMRLLATGECLAQDEALAMLQELKMWPLLNGYRGRTMADVDALIAAIVSFSRMGADLGKQLVEVEANPLLVFPKGKGVIAVDGVATIDAFDAGFLSDADELGDKHPAYPSIVSSDSASLLPLKG
jgi:acetate---CoA ligase (ADP-forming)